ncbi:Alpha/beta hydrolase family protein [Bremerella volcania]|uniref:Alpha/beta hydrolase family protein n=1 Tax=Bremerella volcania TaxID=2527984 RepID=A0A518CEP3_9BACT|nr:PHB depolymerase family esterase [Bremerella volcania]QDU77707.1 Alpha/beta hydrolase family protein [Bremerella volcania]
MFRHRRWVVLLLLTGVVGWLLWGGKTFQAAEIPSPPTAGQFEISTESEGYTRTALVHIPKNYNAQMPPPLVIAMHGAGGGAESILDHDNWAKLADEKGFIVVAPNGLPARPRLPSNFLANPQLWNSGQLREGSPRSKIDDVAYIGLLLDDLAKKVPYDKARVFAIGHSNGGGMTFRLGAEMADRLAAIGTVAGMVAVEDPKPTKPLPTLFIFGTEDPVLPIDGGESSLPWGTRTTPPVTDLMEKWAKAIGCETEPTTTADDDAIKKVRYRSRKNGPELTILYLKGHGHQWRGASRNLPPRLIGPITSKLDATAELWKFFENSTK